MHPVRQNVMWKRGDVNKLAKNLTERQFMEDFTPLKMSPLKMCKKK